MLLRFLSETMTVQCLTKFRGLFLGETKTKAWFQLKPRKKFDLIKVSDDLLFLGQLLKRAMEAFLFLKKL